MERAGLLRKSGAASGNQKMPRPARARRRYSFLTGWLSWCKALCSKHERGAVTGNFWSSSQNSNNYNNAWNVNFNNGNVNNNNKNNNNNVLVVRDFMQGRGCLKW